MKRLVVVLGSLLVLPAFAEVAPTYYEEETEFSDVELDNVDTSEIEAESPNNTVNTKNNTPQISGRNSVRSKANSRSAVTSVNTRNATQRANGVRSRSIAVRNTTTPVKTTSISSRRSVNDTNTEIPSQRNVTRARAGTINSTTTLYNPNTAARASVVARGSAMRSASVTSVATTTAETAADTTSELDTLKSLTEYCQAQYASCMDNYCNVLDDNQGRCSCSKNISNYEKTEAALESATVALQDVARSIQYIGLPADQITTLFTETEAELSMKNQDDNSSIRSSLDKVKRMIVNVESGNASAVESGTMNFDLSGLLDFDMNNTGFDLSSFMNTTSSNTNSISNQRGESLYKTATARCKASVLNSCVAQGVDAAIVTNSYDLEIDKSCLAYERNLTDSNTQMVQTVANAKEVLKKARLMVAQNKNSYDLRGCVSALESCLQDDYVCGNNYESCLDPTGQYIVNGSVVIGSMPGNNTNTSNISSSYSHDNLFETWETDDGKNPWKASSDTNYISLIDYITKTVSATNASKASDKISAYLQNKIGYHDDKNNKDYGMCMSVLNKCQDYTYDNKGKYKADNEVIKQFLQRALVQIKTQQDELLASYAEDCVNDVSSCLSSNNYDEDNPDSTKSRTAINSCYSQIKTCMSVNGNIFGSVSTNELRTWVTGTYSTVETFTTTPDITNVCQSITDADECASERGYCLNTNGVSSSLGYVCTWTADSNNTNGGTCGIRIGTTCN